MRIETVTVDAREPEVLARWWAELLRTEAKYDDVDEWVVDADGASLLFLLDTEEKVVKNRWHLDLRPDDQDAEVARAESLGARRVEIGQSEDPQVSWVVLADPEGNEFCILRSKPLSSSCAPTSPGTPRSCW